MSKRTTADDLVDEAQRLQQLLLEGAARLVAFTEQLQTVINEAKDDDDTERE